MICCEPDTENYKLLQTKFRNKTQNVVLLNKAVSDKKECALFYIHHETSAFNTLNPKWKELLEKDEKEKWNEHIKFSGETKQIETTTLDSLIAIYGKPDFIKIDVEGYEKWVLNGLTIPVACISFECMLPDFKNELLDCINILNTLSKQYYYNIAVEEKLLFEKFLSTHQLLEWVNKAAINHFEIVAKLSK